MQKLQKPYLKAIIKLVKIMIKGLSLNREALLIILANYSKIMNKKEEQIIDIIKDKIKENYPEKESKKMNAFLKVFIYLIIFLVVSFIFFSNQLLTADEEGSFFDKLPIIGQIKHLAKSSDKKLKGEESGRINILLLGMGGKKHDGGFLTDTIILASINTKTKKIALLSIPRDTSIPAGKDSHLTKINSINAYAEAKESGSGGMAISQALSDVLDIPIDYYVRVDFQGFVNIVDKLGGLDILVENTLEDFSYPVKGREKAEDYASRFEHLYIKKGWQKMDGTLALKYARSRHAYGIEGSDFARGKRQQLVIQAAKEKVLKTNFLLHPKLITGIISELNEHISTNLKVWEIVKLWKLSKDIKRDGITSKVLDNSPNGLLYNKINEIGAYVLLPKSGDFEEISYFVKNIFENAPKEKKEEVLTERATIEIRNGTWINGLAGRKALDLEKYGFDVINVANSSRRNFEKSIIYDLSFGKKIKSLTILKKRAKASVSFELPTWLIKDITKDLKENPKTEKPDFILILGESADPFKSGEVNSEK